NRRAQRRNPVVAPSFVVFLRRRPFPRFEDQTLLQHPLNRSVQGAGAQTQLAAGAVGDVLDDSVAVAVLVGERDENVKHRRLKRQKRPGFAVEVAHTGTIYPLWIYVNRIQAGRPRVGASTPTTTARGARGTATDRAAISITM